MRILKKINNNVALAKDGNGREIVVFGKGVGFPAMPYELDDLSGIQRTFYDIKSSYLSSIGNLPEDLILLAADIVEMAKVELDCSINPNLPFTLADHLNFAIERFESGMKVKTPLAYDVAHFYPTETELGREALEMIQERLGISLPDDEAINIALHLVNGELENNDMHSTLLATQIVSDVTAIVEGMLHVTLDTSSFNYSRFVLHLRYLIQRLQQDKQESSGMSSTLRQLSVEHPDIYRCTLRIVRYFENEWQWQCNQDEMLYLMVHINRVKERTSYNQEES